MNERNKIILAVIVLLVVLFAISTSLQQEKETEKKVVKIGVISALSGSSGFLGQGVQNSIELAKEQLGDTKYEYEIIYEDDQLNPKQTLTAAQKLINDAQNAFLSFRKIPISTSPPLGENFIALSIMLNSTCCNSFFTPMIT